ncbi:hypothetical protein COB21_04610 [Candidatus Aerophobetes bacterium]|uniref:Uncharacterized protein n=1 Tax=Aerophobetes bacterium TaxID=2030807 RepID=A0A2A4X2J6_UNCAE|nr:MAG: hypothetical protein COB21_04610 [Candidatus Aerophobetes bacterium]
MAFILKMEGFVLFRSIIVSLLLLLSVSAVETSSDFGEEELAPVENAFEVARPMWHIRKSPVKAYGLGYTFIKPMELGLCYRDLSREKITVIEHPSSTNGFDVGLYFNKGDFSMGVYSGINFQHWIKMESVQGLDLTLFERRGPYTGMEISFQF